MKSTRERGTFRAWRLLAISIAALAVPPDARASQAQGPAVGTDSVEVVAGRRYKANGIWRFLFGRRYRELWTAPVKVGVLDLGRFGGLKPTKEGGGKQTKSLRFEDERGREFVFRSVDKDPSPVLPSHLRETFVDAIVQDQVSSSHPAGALVVDPLLTAVGVPHPAPRLTVMPDDPRLGEYREKYAGVLGYFEEYPEEGPDDTPGFQRARKIVGSDELFGRLNADASHRVDDRAFLTARMVDLLINDWDRHEDQWRWIRRGTESSAVWVPVPRDRDQAFVWFDGFLVSLARVGAPRLLPFDERIGNLTGLTFNSRAIDRRLLAWLPRGAWDSIATAVTSKLTDSVIDAAVRRLPGAYYDLTGTEIAAKLKARRGMLRDVALRFYDRLAGAVDLHGTDSAERLEVTREGDGSVTVRLFELRSDGTPARTPFAQRRFLREETDEVRVYLQGGDDYAIVRGEAPRSITVRVIGGSGYNTLVDSSSVGGDRTPTRLYDIGLGSVPELGPDSVMQIDRREWLRIDDDSLARPRPDYGGGALPSALVSFDNDLGLLVRGTVQVDRYGFRREPFASRISVSLGYASEVDGLEAGIGYDMRREGGFGAAVAGTVSDLDVVRFHGFGNETPADPSGRRFRVDVRRWSAVAAVRTAVTSRVTLSAGPFVRYTTTQPVGDRFSAAPAPYGSETFGHAGIAADLDFNTEARSGAARRGTRIIAGARVSPALWDAEEGFGNLHVDATSTKQWDDRGNIVTAVRAGAERVWGRYPFHEAAFVGGRESIRGFNEQRFAGDASLYAGFDLRARLGRFPILFPAELGLIGLSDVGRVFLRGDSSSRWHTAVGGGFWLAFVAPENVVTFTVADTDERTRFYVGAGFVF